LVYHATSSTLWQLMRSLLPIKPRLDRCKNYLVLSKLRNWRQVFRDQILMIIGHSRVTFKYWVKIAGKVRHGVNGWNNQVFTYTYVYTWWQEWLLMYR
jgi:hypothetical protein